MEKPRLNKAAVRYLSVPSCAVGGGQGPEVAAGLRSGQDTGGDMEEIRDPGNVTFNDVAIYFTQRDWQLLADWQKKLYQNIMKEIHGALTALGYEIANPGILVRIQQQDESYFHEEAAANGEDLPVHVSNSNYSLVSPILLASISNIHSTSDK
ncbi:PREDICTED: zinc finger protein 317-like [Nanorana parkeri]|uniref:zinc finger protein 317-like n=1 Tax=Nanorana parkeri TaxID=125878 RepID=UPI0008548EFF|nr:PREDICTED: zinc finger protein 317-like [Nanorana parkeri]